ncbi:MAG: L,D-transpeptidase family protein [Aeromonas sp.]
MRMKYWLALANLVWLGCLPVSVLHAAESNVVTSAGAQVSKSHWYQGDLAQQARIELEQQLRDAVLAQLHPDFTALWTRLQAAPEAERGAIYDQVLTKLSHFQQAWRKMSLIAREQMQTQDLNLNGPAVKIASGDALLSQVQGLRPQVAEYDAVREKVDALLAEPMAKHWPTLTMGTLRPGESAGDLPQLRTMLNQLGDASELNGDQIYDPQTVDAVKAFQRRHGLNADGVIGRQTRTWLNTGPQARASILLRNLWRRDLVDQLAASQYVLVNIPDFRLSVVKDGSEVFTSRVIVGKDKRETPILDSEIRSVVLNPTWTVPRSILEKDILPKLSRGSSYLNEEQFEVITGNGHPVKLSDAALRQAVTSGFPYGLRQKPGNNNALGRYKFYLPNNDSIYLHSTPHKGLFSRDARAFSSGCIRVERADDLANLLLTESNYQQTKIDNILNDEQTKWLSLAKPIPVFTVYWSSWIDANGQQQLRNDIYDFDKVSVQRRLL